VNEIYLLTRTYEIMAEAERAATDARLAAEANADREPGLAPLTRLARAIGLGRAQAQPTASIASATSRTPCSMSDVVTAP
jgi:hypothetical protein